MSAVQPKCCAQQSLLWTKRGWPPRPSASRNSRGTPGLSKRSSHHICPKHIRPACRTIGQYGTFLHFTPKPFLNTLLWAYAWNWALHWQYSFITENKAYRNKKDQKKCTWLTTKWSKTTYACTNLSDFVILSALLPESALEFISITNAVEMLWLQKWKKLKEGQQDQNNSY